MHAQQLPPHAHAPPLPMMPHAAAAMAGLQPPTLPPSSAAGLLALSSSLAAAGPGAHLSAAAVSSVGALKDHRDEKRSSSGESFIWFHHYHSNLCKNISTVKFPMDILCLRLDRLSPTHL